MPQDYQEALQLDLSPVEFLSQTGHKEEIQKIQSHLASLNFSYPEIHHQIHSLSGGQQGKLLLLNLVLRNQTFSFWMSPHETFLQHLNQKLENSLPIILVGLSLFRMIDVS